MVCIKGAIEALKIDSSETPLIRTYFGEKSSDVKVQKLYEIHTAPTKEGFEARLTLVNDPRCEGLTREILLQPDFDNTVVEREGFAFLMDEQSFEDDTLLCVNLERDVDDKYCYPPEEMHITERFRVVPSETCSVQNNISIANMDFADFGECVDENGVFRGFLDGEEEDSGSSEGQREGD